MPWKRGEGPVPEESPPWIQAASTSMRSHTSLGNDHIQTFPKVPISSMGILQSSRLLWEYWDFPHRTNQNPLRKSTKQNTVLKRPMNRAVSQEHCWSCFLKQPQTFEVTGIQESPCCPKSMASKHQGVGLTENEPLPF